MSDAEKDPAFLLIRYACYLKRALNISNRLPV
jgi:hypothetical protein